MLTAGGAHSHDRTPAIPHRPDALMPALVFHLGACYEVCVSTTYDGAEDGLVNMGSWLFTYEFLQAFLDQLLTTATTFRTYLRTAVRGHVMATMSSVGSAVLHKRLQTLLGQLSLDNTHTSSQKFYQAFISAVMDYITLQVRGPRSREAVA